MAQNPFSRLLTNAGRFDPGQMNLPTVGSLGRGLSQPMQQMAMPQQNQMQQNPYEFYQPQNQMQNRFAGLLDQIPQPQEPGKWRKFGALLAGAAAPAGQNMQVAQQSAYAPYFHELDKWQTRLPYMQQAADNERQANTQGLNANNQFRQREFEQRKLDETSRIADEKNETNRLRAQAYAFKQMNPNWVSKEVPGGNIVFFNPQNPQQIYDTGMNSGSMDERDRINLLQSGRMDVVNTQQAGANTRNQATIEGANMRNENTVAGAGDRAEAGAWSVANIPDPTDPTKQIAVRINSATGAIERVQMNGAPVGTVQRPGTGARSGAGATATQQGRAIFNRALQAKNSKPEWNKFIETGPNNTFTIQRPGLLSGPSQEMYNEIYEFIYGTPADETQSRIPNNTTPTNTGPVSFEMGGRIYAIPANEVSEFIQDNPNAVRR